MGNVDYLEVGRVAHELGARLGRRAHLHASELAREAELRQKVDECAFWEAVAASLKPREP